MQVDLFTAFARWHNRFTAGLMTVLTTQFFAPDWPRALLCWLVGAQHKRDLFFADAKKRKTLTSSWFVLLLLLLLLHWQLRWPNMMKRTFNSLILKNACPVYKHFLRFLLSLRFLFTTNSDSKACSSAFGIVCGAANLYSCSTLFLQSRDFLLVFVVDWLSLVNIRAMLCGTKKAICCHGVWRYLQCIIVGLTLLPVSRQLRDKAGMTKFYVTVPDEENVSAHWACVQANLLALWCASHSQRKAYCVWSIRLTF